MKDFERQVLTNKAAVLRRALYGLAVNAREEDVSELNAIISEMTSLIDTIQMCSQIDPEIQTELINQTSIH